eukprot:TRINITY_DN619_c0_g1_i1.p1 TRINITY_DN619_c0_g1~~TRINITY_DN619_c0_g1_i1.p1  ORF type:complete len:278 (+),score=119.57 TRINITY_DN619_c0_g1_i1:37-870(+)
MDAPLQSSVRGRGRGGGRWRGSGGRFNNKRAAPYERAEPSPPPPPATLPDVSPSDDDDDDDKAASGPPILNLEAVTNRLYVMNLAWNTSWQDLKDHMRAAGNVVYAEVFSDDSGRSKGCGIVEFSTRQEALNAISTLNDTQLQGRLIFLREDREDKFAAGARGGGRATKSSSSSSSSFTPSTPAHRPDPPRVERTPGSQIYVHNLPYTTSWQDLKDHFRPCGNIIRADVLYGPDGRTKGAGTVLFESSTDARKAIQDMDNTDFHGRPIYVKEDKFDN